MYAIDEYRLTLEDFEGPIGLLLHLVQKNEVDIFALCLREVTHQYLKDLVAANIDEGAEFIGSAAALLLLKSRALLPKQIDPEGAIVEELDPRFEIIHYLLDYCRFKAAAEELKHREEQQNGFHLRGMAEVVEAPKPVGAGALSLNELCALFQKILERAPSGQGIIQSEMWKVSDKIHYIKELLKNNHKIGFHTLFAPTLCRPELIVTFLAVLELMKQGVVRVKLISAEEIEIYAAV